MRKRCGVPTLAALLALTAPAIGGEPDFYLVPQSCKTAVGYLVLSDESLKVLDGDPAVSACTRRSKRVYCEFSFAGGSTGSEGTTATAEYNVVIDLPPTLHLMADNGGEYIAIDTTQRAAVVMTRIVREKFVGSKVCQGLYTTDFELKALGVTD